MNKFVSIKDINELIDVKLKKVKEDYESNKISQSSLIAMTGVLISLKNDLGQDWTSKWILLKVKIN